MQVHQIGIDVEDVAGIPAVDPRDFTGGPEQLPNSTQMGIQHVARLHGWIVVPHPVDQQLDGDRPARVHRECGQHGLLPGRADVEQPALHPQLHLPEQPEFHAANPRFSTGHERRTRRC
ncbi:hypothetical protein GCM10011609_10380 [Lentzea pudingi]|uniref:Uncharacterized protein n=1 Tax=Lentzea pudingi TaxID=1789439 RepID=A0ABQ2HEF2_9PSEU|nr:hypothetical protein GCM10011609_10380 [Lentzea pudingi]